ncbi:hypothetical protein KNE206_17330 [Kitasatospora sp. NE20-6]|uniref:HAD family hydrolase n=1 Tax=Kitasatospora sp. NE20-6 TaxID=2859066 RepID=UPI0034DB7E8C
MNGPRLAFFDVDETLITVKSLAGFFVRHRTDSGHPAGETDRILRELWAMVAAGTPRETLNRAFFRHLAGSPLHRLQESGIRWFAEVRDGGLFHPPAVEAVRRHQRDGDVPVLISGSCEACIRPIADHLGITHVLGTELRTTGGPDPQLTGETGQPLIGAGKAVAARALLDRLGARAEDATAYADDATDLPLLHAVGRPVVVGDDPELRRRAERFGWRRLPGIDRAPAGRPA